MKQGRWENTSTPEERMEGRSNLIKGFWRTNYNYNYFFFLKKKRFTLNSKELRLKHFKI